MLRLTLLLSILMFAYSGYCQEDNSQSDHKAVKRVVLEVFDAMRASDSIRLKSCFVEKVDMYTAFRHWNGDPILESGDMQKFYTSVGTPHIGIYDERLGEYEIKLDDDLASIWVDYYFFVDDKFSHCGVDFMQLFRTEKGWKIFFISDTRRANNCEIPDETKLW